MIHEKISSIEFKHNSEYVVSQEQFKEFVMVYWLSQYGSCGAYKKDNRIFATYNLGDMLKVTVVDKMLLPKISF